VSEGIQTHRRKTNRESMEQPCKQSTIKHGYLQISEWSQQHVILI